MARLISGARLARVVAGLLATVLLLATGLMVLALAVDAGSRLYYTDGKLLYQGELVDGAAHGQGTLYDRQGNVVYNGQWQGNLPHGQGQLYNPESGQLVYAGGWYHGYYHGQGRFYVGGQLHYDGQWQRGYRHGPGDLFYDDGILAYRGHWELGVRHGTGQQYDSQGQLLYSGHWQYDLRHGQGELFRDGVRLYRGDFVLGAVSGQGKAFYPQGALLYEGQWLMGKPVGGTCYLDDGRVLPGPLAELFVAQAFVDGFETIPQAALDLARNGLAIRDLVEAATSDPDWQRVFYQLLLAPKPGVSRSVVTACLREVTRVPLPVMEALVSQGVRYQFIPVRINQLPEYQNVEDNVVGFADYRRRLLTTSLKGNPYPANVTLHEIGHAVDWFLLNFLSDSDKFRQIWQREAHVVLNNRHYDMSYFIASPHEYFAEFFAMYFISDGLRPPGGPSRKGDLKQLAPQTYLVFTDLVEGYVLPSHPSPVIRDAAAAGVKPEVEIVRTDGIQARVRLSLSPDLTGSSLLVGSSYYGLDQLHQQGLAAADLLGLLFEPDGDFDHAGKYLLFAVGDQQQVYLGEIPLDTLQLEEPEPFRPVSLDSRQSLLTRLRGGLNNLLARLGIIEKSGFPG